MRLVLVQHDPVVGDVEGNATALAREYEAAVHDGADLVAATELAVTGYPPDDLLLKPAFVAAGEDALGRLASRVGPVPFVVGTVESVVDADPATWRHVAGDRERPPLANAAAVLRDGRVAATYRKQRLPNYGVFDEARYFVAGTTSLVVDVAGTAVGVTVCEDLWGDGGPVDDAAQAGAALVLNLNASPYSRGKRAERERWARTHTSRSQVFLAYTNQVGGQDELVFDGDSFVMAPDGEVVARGPQFAEARVVVDLPLGERAGHAGGPTLMAPRLDPLAEVWAALVLGTRDYVRGNGFARALVGVSGGVDSAVTAAVAVDALGPDAVTGVAMPSPHSSPGSLTDAKALAADLSISYLELPIGQLMEAFAAALAGPFTGTEAGLAEENLQSRIRGTLLMALSNKHGDILLATGNKSEYAVGYSTLYGDMAGGFAVLKDVPKTLVFELARWRNAQGDGERVPVATIEKPPSAELRPDQADTDSLPPYDVLDPIIEAAVVDHAGVADLVDRGFDADVVRSVFTLLDRAEYKRRQAAPGVKITERAFGRDRRLPITQSWSA